MTDIEIIDLYFNRSESAISETEKQYGSYCLAIAMNILHNKEDSAECVNDTFLSLWNSIPPEHPKKFSAYIGRITRNLSIKMYKKQTTQTRGGNETALLLSELDLCIPSVSNVESEVEMSDLVQAINSFLLSIKKEDRIFFVNRFWYADTIPEIARQFNVGESKVGVSLHRTRKKLKTYLEKRGITL